MQEQLNNAEKLREAIRNMHGCESVHVESVPVTERFQGAVVWDGTIEVFDLVSRPQAKQCFAWSHPDGGGERFFAVLALPPVTTPIDAVRAAIVSESKKR